MALIVNVNDDEICKDIDYAIRHDNYFTLGEIICKLANESKVSWKNIK